MNTERSRQFPLRDINRPEELHNHFHDLDTHAAKLAYKITNLVYSANGSGDQEKRKQADEHKEDFGKVQEGYNNAYRQLGGSFSRGSRPDTCHVCNAPLISSWALNSTEKGSD